MKLNLTQYKSTLIQPLRQVVLGFLIKPRWVLLALKKRGFGQGKWNGFGGKVEEETIEEAMIREMQEEIGVTPKVFRRVATLNFYFPLESGFGQEVVVFIADDWEGEIKESEEMSPKWFRVTEIPYEKMWWDDKYWMPRVLAGEILRGEFLFDGDETLLEMKIETVVAN